MQTLQNMSRDKMVIATMHRPSTAILNQFNKVLVLDTAARWPTGVMCRA